MKLVIFHSFLYVYQRVRSLKSASKRRQRGLRCFTSSTQDGVMSLGINVLAPSVQQNEKCTFQLHIGESEVGDVQDSPDSLETGVDSERYRNL